MPNYNQYPYPQVMPPQYPQYPQMPSQQTPQIQSGGFIPIQHESMVDTYPVEMGKCVTFKVVGKPIVIEKTIFSQFEPPMINRYRLVKEEAEEEVKDATPENIALDSLKGEIKAIWNEIANLKEPRRPVPKKKEVADDTEYNNSNSK